MNNQTTDLKSDVRSSFLLTAALIYLFVALLLYPLYSPDYFSIRQAEDHFAALASADLIVGRFASAFFIKMASYLRVDPFNMYPLYLVATAIAIGCFLRRLYLCYFNLERAWPLFAIFAFTFLFSGAMFDLLMFREVAHHALLMFALAYLFLKLEDMEPGALRTALRVVVVVFLFATYQASVVMILMLSLIKGMFDSAEGAPSRAVASRILADCAMIFAALIVYLIAKISVEHHFGFEMSRKMLDFRAAGTLSQRATEHYSALMELFKTPGGMYRWSHVGIGLTIVFIGILLKSLLTGWRSGLATLLLALMTISLFQNPMNLMMADYWPTLRSSFYIALVPGLILAYVYSRTKSSFIRKTKDYLVIAFFALYASAGFILLLDGYGLRRLDYLLARDIASAVRGDPQFASAKTIRISNDWQRAGRAYYPGMTELRFDFGAPIMLVSWSAGPYLNYVTGLDLKYLGTATCSQRDSEPKIDVSLRDGAINVCF